MLTDQRGYSAAMDVAAAIRRATTSAGTPRPHDVPQVSGKEATV
jgi:hypothetical protein